MESINKTIRFPYDLHQKIDALAVKNYRTFSQEVFHLCRLGLEGYRDNYFTESVAENKEEYRKVVKEEMGKFKEEIIKEIYDSKPNKENVG